MERKIYEMVEKRIIERINNMASSVEGGDVQQHYSCILTLLLRLRQMTCHILLVENCLRDLLTPDDMQELQEILNEFDNPNINRRRHRTLLELRAMIKK